MKLKYGNKKIEYGGRSFSSRLESSVYELLYLQQLAKEIKDIQCQVHVHLTDADIVYVSDFKCIDKHGEVFYAEAKGYETPEWRIKLRLWKYYGPAPLHIYRGKYKAIRLDEIVIPKQKKL